MCLSFKIRLAGQYQGPGKCRTPIIDFIVGQDGANFNKVDLPHCLQGCFKLSNATVHTDFTDSSLGLHDMLHQEMGEVQELVSQGRLHARFWSTDFDADTAVVVWTMDVGQSDDKIKLYLDNKMLNDDQVHELFIKQFSELMFEEQTGASAFADETHQQLAVLGDAKNGDAEICCNLLQPEDYQCGADLVSEMAWNNEPGPDFEQLLADLQPLHESPQDAITLYPLPYLTANDMDTCLLGLDCRALLIDAQAPDGGG